MSEKLCLQLNDFKENAIGSLGILKDDKDFLDVTLACEDGKQIEAHKVILVISSPFFQNLLKRNKHPHPLIYMRGLKSDDLLAIIDFLYCGEANVFQENLDSFLAIAEEFQLKGFLGNDKSDEAVQAKTELSFQEEERRIRNHMPGVSEPSPVSRNNPIKDISTFGQHDDGAVALTCHFSGNMQDLDDECNSMMEKTLAKQIDGHPIYRCTVCGKEAKSSHLKDHIEANHLEGISIPCNFCKKTFRSRHGMQLHKLRYHGIRATSN